MCLTTTAFFSKQKIFCSTVLRSLCSYRPHGKVMFFRYVCLFTEGVVTTLTSSGGHCSGRYASYWNAFLLTLLSTDNDDAHTDNKADDNKQFIITQAHYLTFAKWAKSHFRLISQGGCIQSQKSSMSDKTVGCESIILRKWVFCISVHELCSLQSPHILLTPSFNFSLKVYRTI